MTAPVWYRVRDLDAARRFYVETLGFEETYHEAEIRLVESSGGLFEVTVDGTLVYSKKASRRHAQPGEVLKSIQQVRGEK